MKIFGEIGINHNGDIEIAKKLIDLCSDLKIEAVKFQKESLIKFIQKNSYLQKEVVHGEVLNLIKKKVWNLVKKNTKYLISIVKIKI